MLRLAARHLLTDNVIAGRFVEIALALPVDHDAARQRALDRAEAPAILAGHEEDGRGPGRMQVQRVGADRLAGEKSVTLIATHAARIKGIAIKRRIPLAQSPALSKPPAAITTPLRAQIRTFFLFRWSPHQRRALILISASRGCRPQRDIPVIEGSAEAADEGVPSVSRHPCALHRNGQSSQ